VAAAVERLIGDAEFYQGIAQRGAAAAREKFSREMVGARWRELYDGVAGVI
jgi:hypothetical protein